MKKSSLHNIFTGLCYIFLQLFLIISPTLIYFFYFNKLNILSCFFYILLILFIGTRMRALGNIIHECSHYTFVYPKKANIIFGQILCLLDLTSFKIYQQSHALHHRYLGIYDKDQDYNKFKKIINKKNLFFNILNPINWFIYLFQDIIIFEKNKLQTVLKLSIILFVLLFITNKIILTIFLSYVTSYQIFKLFSDHFDHHLQYNEKNLIDRTQNHLFKNILLNLLFLPRNDGYHLLHHMYPSIPIKDFPQMHKKLMRENKEYSLKKHLILEQL